MGSAAIGPDEPGYEGQRHYTPGFLRIYDPLVLGVFCRFVWRCPTPRVLELYERHVGRRHLDVGPGTGTLLARARLPEDVEITLLDPNPNVLTYASRRLGKVRALEADVLKPVGDIGPFDSIALVGVLHCLPAPMSSRAPAIAHLARVLDPDGVLFGTTVLGSRELHTWLSHQALRSNVRKGFFDNADDNADDLRRILDAAFDEVDVELVGSIALFRARRPRA